MSSPTRNTPPIGDAASRDRLLDLLAARAVEGLDAGSAAELESLLLLHPDVDATMFDRAAAAAWIAAPAPAQPLPDTLRNRILLGAPQGEPLRITRDDDRAVIRWKRRAWSGWLVAAAAIVLACTAWWPRIYPPPAPTASALRAALLNSATDVRTISWSGTQDPLSAAITGDVVWSDARNEGYMRIRGLPENLAQNLQYQLWIFDDSRKDPGHPVSAGLFNIPAAKDGEIVIPLRPGLPITKAAVFAISAEKPGGAVLPNTERVIAVAK
jgi:anti-sigma-K factor RskA